VHSVGGRVTVNGRVGVRGVGAGGTVPGLGSPVGFAFEVRATDDEGQVRAIRMNHV
jgi:hypothetical protein